MDIEELRTHLGDELFTQVSEKLAGVSDLRVISTANGSWIPKAKFDEERKTVKQLQDTIASMTQDAEKRVDELNAAIREREQATTDGASATQKVREELQGVIDRMTAEAQTRDAELTTAKADLEAVRGDLAAAKTDIATRVGTIAELTKTIEEHKGTISALNRDAKERRMIRAAGARDEDVVIKLIDQGRVSEGEDGTLAGVAEQLEELKKSSGYLFSREHPQRGGFNGGREEKKPPQPATADVNAAIRAAFGR